MDYVGTGWKQKLIERLLGISGKIFYHLFLRPKEYLDQRKKERRESPRAAKKGV